VDLLLYRQCSFWHTTPRCGASSVQVLCFTLSPLDSF
jgi:hypothetical protein